MTCRVSPTGTGCVLTGLQAPAPNTGFPSSTHPTAGVSHEIVTVDGAPRRMLSRGAGLAWANRKNLPPPAPDKVTLVSGPSRTGAVVTVLQVLEDRVGHSCNTQPTAVANQETMIVFVGPRVMLNTGAITSR